MVSEHDFMEQGLISDTAFTDLTSRRYLFNFAILYFVFLSFAFWFYLFIDYGYWKRWFDSVCECEDGYKELFVLELCDEFFLKGKMMWGYVSGTSMIPKNIDEGYVLW